MSSQTAKWIILFAFYCICTVKCQSIQQSQTGALLFTTQKDTSTSTESPSTHTGFSQTFTVSPAAFGYSSYTGSVQGILVLPANETYHQECPTTAETLGINPYIHYFKDWLSSNTIPNYIFIVDRGDCYFVEKAEQAQNMGASAVIICDWKNEELFSMWAIQDWIDDISIPTVLLSKNDCATLMQQIGVQNWDPMSPQNMKYPTVVDTNWTIATIKWGLPISNNKVQWSFWGSSNNLNAALFRRNFNSTAVLLNSANDTIFTPHMYILNGSHWGCDISTLPCKTQCSNSGRYCAVDPEYDMSVGLDGIDVIQENLRSLCVWEYDAANFGLMRDAMWWNYSTLWDVNCGILATDTVNTFNEACSYAQMDKLDKTSTLKSYVQNCITSSGGYGYHDGENTILKRELRLKANSSILSVPIVVVNGFQFKSPICKPPITKSSCSVLAAICNGFIDGSKPDICSNNVGCDGVPNSDKLFNECGACVKATDPNFDYYGKDCRGVCPTSVADTYYIDNCGNCLLPSDARWNGCEITADAPCNYGVNYTDFYETYVMDTCYNLNPVQLSDPIESSIQYTCDFVTGDINENIWPNQMCSVDFSQSNDVHMQQKQCDLNKNGKQCNFVWLNQFESLSTFCAPHQHSIIKYAMIINQCITYNLDNTTFKNVYTINNETPQITQFQYNNIDDCLSDNNNSQNSLAKNIIYFIDGACNGGSYYFIEGPTPNPTIAIAIPTPKPTQKHTLTAKPTLTTAKPTHTTAKPTQPTLPTPYPTICESSQKDCKGTCFGNYKFDSCNQCLLPSDSSWNSCVGCDGVINSKKRINPCGYCLVTTDQNFETYGIDCGECWDNVHYIDDCGECLLLSDPNWNTCIPTLEPTIALYPTLKPSEMYVETARPTVKRTSFEPTLKRTSFDPTLTFDTSLSENIAQPSFDGMVLYPTYSPTMINYVERKTETFGLSVIGILFIVIGILVVLLCLCGIYVLYVKYKKHSNIAGDYQQNIIAIEGEGELNFGERDYEEPIIEGDVVVYAESDPSTAIAQTNKL